MSEYTNTHSDEIVRSILEILTENELESAVEVTCGQGSEIGHGFNSETFTVDAGDGNKFLHLFCKAPPKQVECATQNDHVLNEILFYNTIYPSYRLFLKGKGVEDGFRNVPRCYGIRGELIVLENLKRIGYNIFDERGVMNEEHIIDTFKIFAKFHAISFAMKDQKKELYHSFIRNISSFGGITKTVGFDEMLAFGLEVFLKTLDPIDDKLLLDGSTDLLKNLMEIVLNVEKGTNDYSIITQGGSWCNNIMYSYDQENYDKPLDIMLVDWQRIHHGSPVLDLSCFFYPIASEATIKNIEFYLKMYHDELSAGIKQLGSNPEVLYPPAILEDEWKRFAKYGFAMSVIIIKPLLLERDDIADVTEDIEKVQNFVTNMKKKNPYINRMKMILKHFIDNNLL